LHWHKSNLNAKERRSKKKKKVVAVAAAANNRRISMGVAAKGEAAAS
jgi:hypothetical protein